MALGKMRSPSNVRATPVAVVDRHTMLARGEILEGKPGSLASEPCDLYTLGPCPASSIYLTL